MLLFSLNKTSPNFIELLSANPINYFKFYYSINISFSFQLGAYLLICFAFMNFLSKSIGLIQENKTAFFQLARLMHLPLGS